MTPIYTSQATGFLNKQPAKKSERIKKAINALPAGDVKKLCGIPNGYRLRIGDVRILFKRDGEQINVIKIDNRGDVYK